MNLQGFLFTVFLIGLYAWVFCKDHRSTKQKSEKQMISITDSKFQDKDMKNEVKFTFNDSKKSAECACGNKWTPVSYNDYKCRECK